MNIKVLVSTMNNTDPLELYNNMNLNTSAVIVNQCNREDIIHYKSNQNSIEYINSIDRGLSKSRNKALEHACIDDICMIADDDMTYVNDYSHIVEKAFRDHQEYDVLVFQVEGINDTFKKYSKNARQIGYLTSLKISSVEMAIKVKSIKEHNIKFNELFGAGAEYKMGEENIFLFKCINKGLKIKYLPLKIADLYIGDSTWFSGFNKKYFFDKGAVFYEMTKKMNFLLILQFAIRKYKVYRKNISFCEAMKSMNNGKNEYIRALNKK
ncbi:glycosyltransferase family A protein [Planococcus shenhongbingii]|uniref:glycosyltransferase family A protein n=1 Tax=Planococcus shenhongbingii TaxID=3058398 RepID=UPI00261986AB|nr:glycosyltransferase family A protein [Planococcus sp. N016]WKA57820.1 glycosyltransferase family A protein [Planococcus sp. N016]